MREPAEYANQFVGRLFLGNERVLVGYPGLKKCLGKGYWSEQMTSSADLSEPVSTLIIEYRNRWCFSTDCGVGDLACISVLVDGAGG